MFNTAPYPRRSDWVWQTSRLEQTAFWKSHIHFFSAGILITMQKTSISPCLLFWLHYSKEEHEQLIGYQQEQLAKKNRLLNVQRVGSIIRPSFV